MEPDFKNYSFAELMEVSESIDKDKHPERYAEVERLIQCKSKPDLHPPHEKSKVTNWGDLFISLFFCFLGLNGIRTGIIGNSDKIGNYNLSENPVAFWSIIGFILFLSLWRITKFIKANWNDVA